MISSQTILNNQNTFSSFLILIFQKQMNANTGDIKTDDSINDDELGKKPEQRGVVGLISLNDSGFMNAIIQCLAQTPYLTQYFLNNKYLHDINKANPYGYKGKIAKIWGELLKQMFSNKYKDITPLKLRNAIHEIAPDLFSNIHEDSKQLLSVLLNALIEDLRPPMNKMVKGNKRQSIIVDLMEGKYKSEFKCNDCNEISITFDPYNIISLPIPKEKYKIIEYTFIDCTKTNIIPTVYGIKINKSYNSVAFKKLLSKRHNVNRKELYVCDIWKSKFHREFRKPDTVAEIHPRNDDIFVYYSPKPKLDEIELKEANNTNNSKQINYSTYLVCNKLDITLLGNDMDNENNFIDDDYIGCPLLFTLHLRQKITFKELRCKIFDMIIPFTRTRNETMNHYIKNDISYKINDYDLPFKIFAKWEDDQKQEITYDNDNLFNIYHYQSILKFEILWNNWAKYRHELYDLKTRHRHSSAPPSLNDYTTSINFDYYKHGLPIELDSCFDLFTDIKHLNENDTWYCNKCQTFKKGNKKIDLWKAPDILIIHLNRLNYTENNQDRRNTLVKFPLKGLNIKHFLANKYRTSNCVYDLFAVCNHISGKYTAYSKNIYNNKWYFFDNSITFIEENTQQIISSSAYILFYHKRK